MPTLLKTPTELTTFYATATPSDILRYFKDNPKAPITGQYEETALHWAAFRGLPTLTEALLARGYDPNKPDKENQRTPLHWATQECQKRHSTRDRAPFEKIIALLRQHRAITNTQDHRKKSPLDIAGKKSKLRDTLTEPASYFDLTKRYNKPFKEAILTNNLTALKKFSAADLLAFKDTDYNNALLLAVRHANVETFRALAKKLGPEESDTLLKQTDYYSRDAVMLAAIANNSDMLDLLYELKNPYHVVFDPENNSALTYAIKRDSREAALKLLLKYHIPLHEIDKNLLAKNETLRDTLNTKHFFLKVVSSHNPSLFTYVLRHIKTQSAGEQQTYLSCVNKLGENAIMLAAKAANKTAALTLVQLTALDLTQCNKEGLPILAYLVRYDCLDAVLHILNTDPNVFTAENQKTLLQNLQYVTLSGDNATQTAEIRRKISNALTRSTHTCTGATSRFSKALIPRKPRTYARERATQLLRQGATQLYLAAKKQANLKELVEVQIMVLPDNLVIAVNPASLSAAFSQWLLQHNGNLQPLLSQIHEVAAEHGSKTWSTRHAHKLQYSLFSGREIKLPVSNSPADEQRAYHIATLLKKANLHALPALELNKSYQLSAENRRDLQARFANLKNGILILLVNTTPCAELHAEEYLKILFQYLQESNPDLIAEIKGKKRPCLSCAAAIEHIGAAHNTRPGLFFRAYFNTAPDAAAHGIAKKLLGPQYITVDTKGKTYTHFDTASDSEVEERVTKLTRA